MAIDRDLRTEPPVERERDVLASDVNGAVVPAGPAQPAGATEVGGSTTTGDVPGAPSEAAPPRSSWPLMLAVAGWPLWWAMGFTNLVFILAAIPLGWTLFRRRPLVYPPGFILWALFLILVVVSAFGLNASAAGTVDPSGVGRYFAYAARLANYGAVTVVLLYIGNATERELPRKSLINWLAVLGASGIALGALALLLPDLSWTSPVARIVPEALADRPFPRLAQVQEVLGDPAPRPAAPYAYTNAWGNATALLMVWLVVALGVLGSSRRRLLLALALIAAVPPVVYSLNRGMWVGLVIAAVVVAVRLAARGRVGPVVALAGLVAALALTLAASPLGDLVQQRLASGHSNEVRESLASTAIDIAEQSPIVGFGSTRETIGSEDSIAVGPTPDCPRCGGRVIGSTGQFTLLLVAQGLVGVLLYGGYLIRSLWLYRSDHSPLGIAAWTVILVEIFFGFFYTALTVPLAITMCSIGLLWRNAQVRAAATG